jgi:hypothetical protein
MEAILLSTISAAGCAPALVFHRITLFGVPTTIISDCGPQFTANVWAALCNMLSILHCQTTAYHPEANSAVSRETALPPQGCASCPRWRFNLGRGDPLSSTASIRRREKTQVFPQLKQFLEPPFCCLTNFCKMKNFLLIKLSKNLSKS